VTSDGTPASGPGLRDPLVRALLALTFTTGLIDAASYLGLGHVFSANMTGNVVLLGFGIAGAGGLPVVSPIVALIAFLVGAGIGGRLARELSSPRKSFLATLALEASLVAVSALIALVHVRANRVSGDIVVGLLALAMGARNASVRRLGVPDLTTTVLTMTLTGLTAEWSMAGGSGSGGARRLAAVLAMLGGAVVGALALETSVALPLVVAAALAVLVGLFQRVLKQGPGSADLR
jgi:uncharacterized membrane protein YoaK (UPF0700 family)